MPGQLTFDHYINNKDDKFGDCLGDFEDYFGLEILICRTREAEVL